VLRDDQIAILCEISPSIAFADDKQGEVENLIVEGYVMKDGDLFFAGQASAVTPTVTRGSERSFAKAGSGA
jgi:hypothetical protein